MEKDFPLFITGDNVKKRNYVFNSCIKFYEEYEKKKDKKPILKKLDKYTEDNFVIYINDLNNIQINFKENGNEEILYTTHFLREVTINLLTGNKKKFWLVNKDILHYYLQKQKIMYPIFHKNNLDCTLNEKSYVEFIQSNLTIIEESDKPDLDYKIIINDLSKNIQTFSEITFSNEKYFIDSFKQNKCNNILLETPFQFNLLLQYIVKQHFEELNILKNSKCGFSSLLYLNLKRAKKLKSNFCFLYIDFRFFSNNNFSSKEKTETLLKESIQSVKNEDEYNELKKIILQFNNYSTILKKVEKLIKYYKTLPRNIIIIIDHFNLEYLSYFKTEKEIIHNNVSFIKVFSLEDTIAQEKFLEQLELEPDARQFYLLLNYPAINNLPNNYLILNNNPYYYGLNNTKEEMTFNQICIEERGTIFQILEKFYKNNIKNIFHLLNIKKHFDENEINYSDNKTQFQNIPLDLFEMKLYENKPGIKQIKYKNYLIKKTIKNFIRKKILSANIEPEINDEMTGGNKGFLLEDLFDIFFTSNELPFSNIKYVSEILVDKIINNSKIIDDKYSIIKKYEKENIFIHQDNDNAKNYDSALILNYNNKRILKIYQVTEGEKAKKTLKNKYTLQSLKKEFSDTVISNVENLLGLKFDIVEFKFVLNYYTYKTNAINVINFCKENNVNDILFDYKNYLLFDKNEDQIKELKIDNNSIIIGEDKISIINNFYNEEDSSLKKDNDDDSMSQINNISNNNEDIIITTNLNKSNNSISDLINNIPVKEDNNMINIEDDNSINKSEFNNDTNLFEIKYNKKTLKRIKNENIEIGILKVNQGGYFPKIFAKVQKIKEIKRIDIYCRIYLINNITINQLYNTYKLKENQFIYIYIQKRCYFVFEQNNTAEIYSFKFHSEKIDNLENNENIIVEEGSSILVFNYVRKESSQVNLAEKRKKINEDEYHTIGKFNSYFK